MRRRGVLDGDVFQEFLIQCAARDEHQLCLLYTGALIDETLGELFEIGRGFFFGESAGSGR